MRARLRAPDFGIVFLIAYMSSISLDIASAGAPAGAAASARAAGWRAAPAVFGAWTLVGLVGLAGAFAGGEAVPLSRVFWTLESVWLWALFTPLIFAAARRWPLEQDSWRRHLGAHAAAALAIHVVDVAVDQLFVPFVGGPAMADIPAQLVRRLFINLFSYAGVAAIAHAIAYQREAAERRARAAELEQLLLRARLQALESQIHPHFLFNTLNSVAALIRAKEDRAAIAMLVGLSDLLRLALKHREAQEVPLGEELEFVGRYLDVERIRFQDRLRAEVEVAPDTPLDALVPHLILQPLVENAIRHGVEARAAAGQVRVRVGRENGALRLSVSDDGPGPADAAANGRGGRGIGLGTTRERLRHLYGERGRCELASGEGGGAVATVELPLRPAAHG